MGHSTIKSFMMKAALAFAFYCIFLVSARRAPPSSQATATEAATEAATTAAVDSSSDDAVQTLVKAYIDAGTCGQITTGDSCGDSAESYYSEFEYNGRRVVIANGIPNHVAEHDQYFVNPNTRCERWTFMSLPLSPTQASSPVSTDMGVTGLANTGGTFYKHLWTVALVTVLLMASTTTMPTSCVTLMLWMPMCVLRLDMPGMEYLFMVTAMMLLAHSFHPATA